MGEDKKKLKNYKETSKLHRCAGGKGILVRDGGAGKSAPRQWRACEKPMRTGRRDCLQALPWELESETRKQGPHETEISFSGYSCLRGLTRRPIANELCPQNSTNLRANDT